MKVDKIVKTTKQDEVTIKSISLLTEEQYKKFRALDLITPKIGRWWWLLDPEAYDFILAPCVYETKKDYTIKHTDITYCSLYIRPILIGNFRQSGFKELDKFNAGGVTWTVLADEIALCDEWIGKMCFVDEFKRRLDNDYQKSDIKKYIENWAREKKII